MADADDATNELIARILAGDAELDAYNTYEDDDIGNGECSDDSDFDQPARYRGRTGRSRGNGAAHGLRGSAQGNGSIPSELLEGYTESGRRRRKDQGAKRETVSKGWTAEEEKLFLEALELHGREWHRAAAHVGSRDKKQFTSHAQKHFIKLCIANKALPGKVIQTGQGNGLGYTLSGHLLDPECASARAYGLRPEHIKRLLKTGGPGLKGLLLPEKENAAVPNGEEEDSQDGVHKSKICRTEGQQDKAGRSSVAEEMGPPPEPTQYAKNRPKREGAGMRSAMGHTSESLELTVCKDFIGPPGSGSALAQPFEVTVNRQVNLIMDFHAHLCGCEIIGLLGGTWDAERRHIQVEAAFPCERVEGSHSGTSVEVDPASQLAAQDQMEAAGLTSVGWYHSHPIFAAIPSQKDNENQRNQQALHRCSKTGLEPCLGAIVSPYDQSLQSEASVISWFVVQRKGNKLQPYRVRLQASDAGPSFQCDKLLQQLTNLIHSTVNDSARTDFLKEWRPFRLIVDGQASGCRLTHLAKMRLAISHHLRGDSTTCEQASELLSKVFAVLKEAWNITEAEKIEAEE